LSESRGTVYETGGGVYRVRLDDGDVVEASLRGRLKREQRTGSRVVIGDRVELARSGDGWTVERVEERSTELVRRGRSGRTPKILVANLDKVFAVVSGRDPDASTELVDRLLVLIESSGMHPLLVINKLDLPGSREVAAEFTALYGRVGYRVMAVSVETGEGLNALGAELCRGTSTLIGPSGVGKSSILNALDPKLELRTGGLSRKTGTGRHTTVGSRIIPLDCGGQVADTPGFGDVGLWSVAPEEIAACFPEIAQRAERCRFRGCSHDHEPDCAVREAVESGAIAESRYRSYLRLRGEAAG
jgi:ribosome biogenesis GTPase / thiamine phosphate phosphatase